MENMNLFFHEMLISIAEFLGSDPIIYIFGLVCLVFVLKAFNEIIW